MSKLEHQENDEEPNEQKTPRYYQEYERWIVHPPLSGLQFPLSPYSHHFRLNWWPREKLPYKFIKYAPRRGWILPGHKYDGRFGHMFRYLDNGYEE